MKMGLSARHGRLPRPDAVDDLIAFGVQRKAAVEWIGKRSDTVDETAPRWRDLEPDMRIRIANLYRLAGKVFVDRNAKGLEAPGTPSLRESGARRATAKDRREQDRLKIKAEMRPHLRKAIAHGRKSRDALLAGDLPLAECEWDRARMFHAFALIEFYQPFSNRLAERHAMLPEFSADGGAAIAKAADEKHEELDGLILACLRRGEKTRQYAKAWQQAFNVSADTVERRIAKAKESLARRP